MSQTADDLNCRNLRSRRIQNDERAPSFHSRGADNSNPVSVSEGVTTNNMAVFTNLAALNSFSGRPEEDVLDFLKLFELWANVQKADDTILRSALPLFLKDGASAWYDTQHQDIKESYAELKRALIKRYNYQEEQTWQAMAELWQTKQSADQSTDDYVTAILRAGQRLKVSESQIYSIVLNGLRPAIRQHVVQHPLSSLDDVRHWGRVTELSLRDNASASSTLEASVNELTAGLTEELRQLRIHSVGASSRPSSPAIERSTISNRVHFQQDAGRRSPPCDDDFERRRIAEKHRRNPDQPALPSTREQLKFDPHPPTKAQFLLKQQLQEASDKNKMYLEEIASMRMELKKHYEKILQLTNERDSREEEVTSLRQAFNEEKGKHQRLIVKTEDEIRSLNDGIDEEKKLNAELSRQMEELRTMSTTLKQELNSSKNQSIMIEELEAEIEKLGRKCAGSKAETVAAKRALRRVRNEVNMQRRYLNQTIDKMKQQHREDIEDLEDKANDFKAFHAKELDKLIQTNDELRAFHRKQMSELLKQKEEELQEQHKEEKENLEREYQQEMERLQSKHTERIGDLETLVESQKQMQIQKLAEEHRKEIVELVEELNRTKNALTVANFTLSEWTDEKKTELKRLKETHAKEVMESRTEFDRRNEKKLQSTADRYEAEIRHLRDRLNAAEGKIEELDVKDKENERKLELLETSGLKHEEGNNKLTGTSMKGRDRRIGEKLNRHQHEIGSILEEITKGKNFAAKMEQNYDIGLKNKQEEIANATTKDVREITTLQSRWETKYEKQFHNVAKKHEDKFWAFLAERKSEDQRQRFTEENLRGKVKIKNVGTANIKHRSRLKT